MSAILHDFDFGDRALANLTLASGERVLLTIVPSRFAVHRLHLFGLIPGRCLFGANDFGAEADGQRARARLAAIAAAAAREEAPGRSATHAFLDAATPTCAPSPRTSRSPARSTRSISTIRRSGRCRCSRGSR